MVMSHTANNYEVSSAKNFRLTCKPSGKLFMYIKSNKAPKIDLLRITASTSIHDIKWHFKITRN